MSSETKPRELEIYGHKVLVDEDDAPMIQRYTWHIRSNKGTFYANTNCWIRGKSFGLSMHRLITGMRKGMIDHKNRNGLDNRKENLRFCSARENSYNRVRKNQLGYRGVYKPANSSNFAMQIQANGKRYHKRGFKTAEEAARYYDKLNRELHGEFGIRNFKD